MSERKKAAIAGEKTYSTGKACKHGHFSRRFTTTGACVECSSLANAAARRQISGLLSGEQIAVQITGTPDHVALIQRLSAAVAAAPNLRGIFEAMLPS